MEDIITAAILIVASIISGISLLGAAGLAFGTDSRPGLGDDHAR
jgi:hypothetical protein